MLCEFCESPLEEAAEGSDNDLSSEGWDAECDDEAAADEDAAVGGALEAGAKKGAVEEDDETMGAMEEDLPGYSCLAGKTRLDGFGSRAALLASFWATGRVVMPECRSCIKEALLLA